MNFKVAKAELEGLKLFIKATTAQLNVYIYLGRFIRKSAKTNKKKQG